MRTAVKSDTFRGEFGDHQPLFKLDKLLYPLAEAFSMLKTGASFSPHQPLAHALGAVFRVVIMLEACLSPLCHFSSHCLSSSLNCEWLDSLDADWKIDSNAGSIGECRLCSGGFVAGVLPAWQLGS